jgi:hypothetical protein
MATEVGVVEALDVAASIMVVVVIMAVDIGKVLHIRVKPLATPVPIL